MAERITQREHVLRNGQRLTVRQAIPADAAQTIAHLRQAAGETDHLSFGPGEYSTPLEHQQMMISEMAIKPNCLFLIGEADGEMVSMLTFTSGVRARKAHQGEFGLTVVQSHWGLGIGEHMLRYLIDWSRQNGVTRKINLRVLVTNTAGIALYRKLGFEEEGRIRRETFLNGQFVDTLLMGLLIDPD